MILNDLYLFLFGLALLLLSIAIVAGTTACWLYIVAIFKKHNESENQEKLGEPTEETEDEKRRKRNEEIIKKYMR